MHKIPYSLGLLCGLFLSGCASNPPLKSMEGQEQVNLEFVNLSPSSPTTLLVYGDDYDCFGLGMLSYGADNLSRTTQTLLKRRYQTFTFQYLGLSSANGGLASTSCTGTYSFETAEAGNYRISLENHGNSCSLAVEYVPATTSEMTKLLELIPRTYSTPFFDSSGPWCVADKRFLGSSALVAPRKYGD